MGPSDIAFLVFPIFFIGMWLLVTSILRSVSGMTTSLPTAPVQALRSSRWGSAAINGVNFGNTVKIQEHSDGYVVRAMRLLHGHLGLVIEPAGAAGVAAILENPERWRGTRIATPLCGGNVTQEDTRRWLLPSVKRSSGKFQGG